MTKNTTFQKRLKELRSERGLTQKALAQNIGISLSSVINYENGQRFPVAGVLSLMQQYFNVSKEYLLGESDERSQATKWDDPEIMEYTRVGLPVLLDSLGIALQTCPDQEQKLAFDILVELLHVTKQRDLVERKLALSLLQDVFSASTRFTDICASTSRDAEATSRIEKAKQVTVSQYSKALDEALIFLSN